MSITLHRLYVPSSVYYQLKHLYMGKYKAFQSFFVTIVNNQFHFLLQRFDEDFSLFLLNRLVEIILALFNAALQSSVDLTSISYLSVCIFEK